MRVLLCLSHRLAASALRSPWHHAWALHLDHSMGTTLQSNTCVLLSSDLRPIAGTALCLLPMCALQELSGSELQPWTMFALQVLQFVPSSVTP